MCVCVYFKVFYYLLFFCPVTFCIPEHGHDFENENYVQARFEGTIYSIHSAAVFFSVLINDCQSKFLFICSSVRDAF